MQKNDEKTTSASRPLNGLVLENTIEIAKKIIKTWPLSKFIIDQGHVLKNANFDPGRQICVFTHSQCLN